jgi:hypothetical protein
VKNRPLLLALGLCAGLLATVSAWGFAYLINSNTGLPIKWPRPVYPLRIMLGTSAGGIDFNATAQAAAQDWNAVLGGVQFQSTTAVGQASERNRVNELVFGADVFGQAFDTNVLAVTTTWRIGNERTEADIVFNSARNWGAYAGPTQSGLVDLQRVALHELGHALGLDHPNEAGQVFDPPLPIMNSRITGNAVLLTDDITGARNLYGPPGTPPNDHFANATLLVLTNNAATVTGFTTNATKQSGEPDHAANSGGHSIWWRWTAPAAGPVSLDTRGSYADTTLGVYTGATLGALTSVASNDDINPGIIQASALTFNATAGTTYHLAVDGFNNADGNGADSAGITLNLGFSPSGPALPVISSQPANVTVATGGTASFTVVATGATGYQWTFNGGAISGATGPTHTIANAQAAHAGSYFVILTNAAGSLNSDPATLTVNAPVPPPAPPPSSGSRGGGGGAPSLWFYGAVSALCLARLLFRRRG